MERIQLLNNIKIDPAKPVLIAGPTASGKSALALALAEKYDGVVVNADALQVYGCWRVLTARPSPADEARAPHLLYGHVNRDVAYSVGEWLREVRAILDRTDGRLPIFVGGTGLYLSSLVNGLAEIPAVSPEIRAKAEIRLRALGPAALLADIKADDPATYVRIDRQNPMRVQRAWEVFHTTGRGLAAWQDDTPPPLLAIGAVNGIVLHAPKDILTPRIEARFRRMVVGGGLDECRANLAGWNPAWPSSKAIGAAELIAHLRRETDLESAITAAAIATRQYAKRQRSWFRTRMKDWIWVELSTGPCG